MSKIDGNRRFKRHEGVLRQEVSGSVILFHMDDGRYYALNEVGMRAWELCDGSRTLSDIGVRASTKHPGRRSRRTSSCWLRSRTRA